MEEDVIVPEGEVAEALEAIEEEEVTVEEAPVEEPEAA